MSKILVFLDAENNELKRVSFEVISAANKLAESTGAEVYGVSVGANEDALKTASEYGLKNAYLAEGEHLSNYSSTATAKVIADLVKENGFDTVLLPANARGLELSPRVAAKLEAGYVADCIELNADGNDVIAKKPVYAGKAIISTKPESATKVFSLRPNVFTAAKNSADLNIEKISPALSADDAKVKVTSLNKNEGKLDVLEADVIVSGGRGLKGPENFPLVENLAKSLGAAVGASRAVVDAGWRPHSEQVGQTGKTVSPSMYVACAISGAVQHLAGMSSSKIIVAINKDKDAPIFKVCDYGIVGDVFEIMPKLTEKFAAVTGNK